LVLSLKLFPTYNFSKNLFLLEVQPTNKEVESGTEATVSCVISGITRQLDSVVWTMDGTDVTTLSGGNYVVSEGTYRSNSQTTILSVKADTNTADSVFNCVITSNEWLVFNKQTNVALNVFGKSHFAFFSKGFWS
jgi:hypothetical protein